MNECGGEPLRRALLRGPAAPPSSLLLPRCRAGKVHWKNTVEQLSMVGPRSLGVCLLTAAFVGMVFTIQFIR